MSSRVEPANPPGPIPPRPHRLLLVVLSAVAAIAVLLVVAAIVAVHTVDLSGFTRGALASLERETGRQLTVGRGPYLRLRLSPSLVAEDVTFANASWGSRREMLRVKRVEMTLHLLPLLHGEIVVGRLLLAEPDLLLETNEKGDGNWAFEAAPGPGPAEKPGHGGTFASRLGIREARMTDALLAYRDGCSGWRTGVTVPRLSLASNRRPKGNLDVDAAVALGRTVVSVSGAIGGPDAALGGRPFPVTLRLATKGATATIEGAIQRLRDLKGADLQVNVEVSDPSALAASVGTTLSRLVPLRAECRVRDAGAGWALDPVRVTAGKSSLLGSAGYTMGCPRSRITLDLRAPRLDLAELTGTAPGADTLTKPASATRGTVFPSEPLALGPLRAFDGTATLQVDTLMLPGGAEARSVAARAVLADGRLTVDPFSLTLGGGRITGSLRLAAGRRPGFTANLTGDDVELQTLLRPLGVRAGISGAPTDLTVALTGGGASPHDWAASLGGRIRVVVGPGRLEGEGLSLGTDLFTEAFARVNPTQKIDRSTELRCAVINVPVEAGVARLDRRVALETAKINVVVGGTVNLGTEMLDVGLRSKATQGLGVGLANFAGAVRLRGPLADPSLGVDAEGAAMAASTLHSAVRTRGRSLVQGRIQDLLVAPSPCKAALDEAPPPRRSLFDLFRRR